MPDSPTSERLAAKRERNRRDRLAAVARWVEYVRAEPPEVWGPQQNAVVDSQLESARQAGLPAEHERRVRAFAAEADDVAAAEADDESPDA